MTPVKLPPLPVEKRYNLLVVISLMTSVALVFAFFLAMLFNGIGKDPQVYRMPTDHQMPTVVPD
jgi:hypothetical protein